MTPKIISQGILRAIGILVAIALGLLFIYKIQSVIVYVAISIVLALIAGPILKFFENKLKLSRTFSVVLMMAIYLFIIMGVISMFIPLVLKQGQHISLLNTNELVSDVKSLSSKLNNYPLLRKMNIEQAIENYDYTKLVGSLSGLLNILIGTLGSFSIGLFSVLFITFFLMKDNMILYNAFLAITPDEKEERILKSIYKIKNLLSRYFMGLIIQVSILFVIYSIILLIFDVESAIVIAFLCALLNLIPYVGPLIGGALMLTLTMTSNLEQDLHTRLIPTTIYVFIGYVIAQLIDNFFSQPIIFSKSVKSHPLEIFLVIIIGGLLFGITGMILAVPIFTALKVILKEWIDNNEVVNKLTQDLED
ncbi:AI-2E family transporter [Namhaeicola litoreus]|uniref:AI-2E family transporter n=1 Tax=Namhaeicola litoreus TaxID=1052145 RepID=A0ABW3Y5V5_9FLAO